MAGEMIPGDRLPSEARLAEQFAVNKNTVRRALSELVAQGILRVENGRGSFVAESALRYAIRPETRFWENIVREGRAPSVDYRGSGVMVATPRVSAALELASGSNVVFIDSLGRADGKPIVLARHFFEADRFCDLPALCEEKGSIRAALRSLGIKDERKTVVVAAHVPTPEESELLDLPWPEPVIEVESIYCDQGGRPIDFGVARYASSKVRLDVL
jgi:GntR family phosphonate transport system transcriptional regulator